MKFFTLEMEEQLTADLKPLAVGDTINTPKGKYVITNISPKSDSGVFKTYQMKEVK